jgi:hypothetical protein
LPEGLSTLNKHACFGGAVSFHEHRSETFDVTMRFAVYAPQEDALMDDETMQLLKVLREQLGKTSASRTVDALAAANSRSLESGSLDFHRRLYDLVRAKYLAEPANPGLSAQGKYLITFEGLAAADNY